MRAISQEMLQISIIDMTLKITNSKLQQHFPEANELISVILIEVNQNNYNIKWQVGRCVLPSPPHTSVGTSASSGFDILAQEVWYTSMSRHTGEVCSYDGMLYTMRSRYISVIFLEGLPKDTTEGSPVGARYGVSFVNAKSGRSFTIITTVLCVL